MNKINLTLDNLVYNLIVKSSEDLVFILPLKVPNDEIKAKDKNVFVPAIETTLKVFVKTDVDPIPEVKFEGQKDIQKIITTGSFKLLPDSLLAVTFTTIDGGLTWLVNSCNAASQTAEGAETIAKNAETVATTATTTANEAKETAETATATAIEASSNANSAMLKASTAETKATEAKTTADTASALATSTNTKIEEISGKMTETEANVQSLEESVTSVSADINETKTNLETTTETANIAKTKAESSVQLSTEGYQTINSGVVLGSEKKFLVTRPSDGDTPLAFAVNKYDELTSEDTGKGLEQFEVGSPKLLMCLNHCGTSFRDKNGETKTVDGHIRVDYKETPTSPVKQDQLAYMSDIKEIKEMLKIAINHIKNTENVVFWIDDDLRPTRENVDPDTLVALPTIE